MATMALGQLGGLHSSFHMDQHAAAACGNEALSLQQAACTPLQLPRRGGAATAVLDVAMPRWRAESSHGQSQQPPTAFLLGDKKDNVIKDDGKLPAAAGDKDTAFDAGKDEADKHAKDESAGKKEGVEKVWVMPDNGSLGPYLNMLYGWSPPAPFNYGYGMGGTSGPSMGMNIPGTPSYYEPSGGFMGGPMMDARGMGKAIPLVVSQDHGLQNSYPGLAYAGARTGFIDRRDESTFAAPLAASSMLEDRGANWLDFFPQVVS